MRIYIVCWAFDFGGVGEQLDYWQTAEGYTEARRLYSQAIEQGAYTATISQVVESTDYEAGGDVCHTL